MATGKKGDGDREAELEAALEAIRVETRTEPAEPAPHDGTEPPKSWRVGCEFWVPFSFTRWLCHSPHMTTGKKGYVTRFAAIAAVAFAIFCPITSSAVSAGLLQDAAKEGDLNKIKQLLAQGVNVNEKTGLAPALHYAIREGHVKAVELLITRGADVNATSTWGAPLHLAASGGHADIARLLLERGADPNARRKTQTPLHLAAITGQTEVVRVLLDHGADINALDELDQPALHLAIINGRPETAALLKERGTKAPPAEDVNHLLASADPARGKIVALPCTACHTMDQSGKIKTGPPLWDIVGRPKASFEKFNYSPALKAVGGEWTYDALNNYLAHPAWTVPGIQMKMKGLPNTQDRADLISFLRTLSNNPAALP
jgi:cytochrome c